ncbi:hypothetical protein [Winogradskyella thalassocola]|uniref:Uncharacterized protein n=1 Tax=Winogradskyella thalassocola TaxID=262004 RepID=A0A1G8D6P1_9FLAO|nr:hypothetical protein [Winogradskyella thalassocola]SDH53019.1 hypothetical protein SAMN04489796_103128 [Winogradskyella thalassocola]
MKNTLLILVLLFINLSHAQEDYEVEINGKTYDIALDKNYELDLNGTKIKLNVKQKDTLVYTDPYFNFKYPKDYKVGKTIIDSEIEQLMLMTAEGSGFIIQTYSGINPTMLNELMINEVTKESVNYGFKLVREDYERTLDSGLKINVNKAVLTYKNEINIYEVASVGKKDSGLILMSMEMSDMENSIGKNLINMIWNTLEIK